jgi:hypothetical protein
MDSRFLETNTTFERCSADFIKNLKESIERDKLKIIREVEASVPTGEDNYEPFEGRYEPIWSILAFGEVCGHKLCDRAAEEGSGEKMYKIDGNDIRETDYYVHEYSENLDKPPSVIREYHSFITVSRNGSRVGSSRSTVYLKLDGPKKEFFDEIISRANSKIFRAENTSERIELYPGEKIYASGEYAHKLESVRSYDYTDLIKSKTKLSGFACDRPIHITTYYLSTHGRLFYVGEKGSETVLCLESSISDSKYGDIPISQLTKEYMELVRDTGFTNLWCIYRLFNKHHPRINEDLCVPLESNIKTAGDEVGTVKTGTPIEIPITEFDA